jgi:type IV secretion system protein VirB8
MSIFTQGANWEAARVSDLERSRKTAWYVAGLLGICLLVTSVALAMLTPLRRTVPYLIKQDAQTGNIEVLQSFDNRSIGSQEVLNKYWARRYVTSREQYNWYLIGSDYDSVAAMTDNVIFKDYSDQFIGEKGLDKVFGDFTERKIKILSIAPSPTNPQQMVVRFERTTISKGIVVEAPTIFVSNMTFRYNPNAYGSEAELIRNPMGYQVFSYRRDVEVLATNEQSLGVKP